MNESISNSTLSILTNELGDVEKVMVKIVGVMAATLTIYLCATLAWHEAGSKSVCSNRYNTWIRRINIIASWLFLIRILPRTIDQFISIGNNRFCPLFYHATNIPLFLDYAFVYGVLFIRQHALITAPGSLDFRFKNIAIIYGKVIFAIYATTNIAVLIILFFSVKPGFKKHGVCIAEGSTATTNYLKMTHLFVLLITQVSLLGLSIFPLIKHVLSNRATQGREESPLTKLIKKSVAIATVCVVTDISVYGLMQLRHNMAYQAELFNISNLTNLYSIVFLFNDWKQMLFPMLCSRNT